MRRHVLAVTGLWILLTAAGIWLTQFELLPPPASDKGEDIARAFRFLLLLSVPVFTFVVAVLTYSVLRFRTRGQPAADGSGSGALIYGRGAVPVAWFSITSALALLIMVYPGLTELPKIAAIEQNPDLVVKVEAFQWAWRITYPDLALETTREMVLPVDESIRFDITSLDVVHGFWVPAFGMKIDAVPGLTTQMSIRTTTVGDYSSDPLFRLQCSQLCGGAHAVMMLPVRVVTRDAFDAWVAASISGGPTASPIAGATQLSISADKILFSTDRLEAPANKPITIAFDNQDVGVFHNIAVYEQGGDLIGQRTEVVLGPVAQTLVLAALSPGTYIFKCDIHPTTMVGTLEIK
ncbi:MAG: cytochrome c oxidase subunit II [Chloroflexota bacterium]